MNGQWVQLLDIISYLLFADADTGIYPHAASQYHARPKAKRGIAMLSVNKFPYPRKQTRCNEFILCWNDACQILKQSRSFKNSDNPYIWPKSLYKHSVALSHRSCKESGRWSWLPFVTSPMTFLSHFISRWWRQTWDACIYFMVVTQSKARVSTEHGMNLVIQYMCANRALH